MTDQRTLKKINTFFGFKNGKLTTIIQSIADNIIDAIDVDYTVENPIEPEKQIEKWKKNEPPIIVGGNIEIPHLVGGT